MVKLEFAIVGGCGKYCDFVGFQELNNGLVVLMTGYCIKVINWFYQRYRTKRKVVENFRGEDYLIWL